MVESLKNKIIKLRKQGISYNQIKEELGCSKATISYHCKNEDLGSDLIPISKNKIKEMQAFYDECKSSIKVSEKFNISKTTVLKYIETEVLEKMSEEEFKRNRSNSVVSWRKRTKEKLVEYKGGKCQCCGYNSCIDAFDFHHLNPNEKDFSVSGKSYSFERLKKEVDKCILVCSNCHREIHAGLIEL